MLVQFNVRNYRSFSQQQTFSMVASASSKDDSRFSIKTNNRAAPSLLRSAAIFGQNGSGKSNLIHAIRFIDQFVLNSAKNSQQGENIDISPFKFCEGEPDTISEFEIVFVVQDTQYQYGVAVDSNRVHDEWMFRLPAGRSQKAFRMFDRYLDAESNQYETYINPGIRGQKEVWRDSTRSNASLFSTAVQLSAEAFMEPFNWFARTLQLWALGNRLPPEVSVDFCTDKSTKDFAIRFLQAADLGIVDVVVEEVDGSAVSQLRFNPSKGTAGGFELVHGKRRQIKLGHEVKNGRVVYLKLEEESDGTKVLFGLIKPWYDALSSGSVLIIDELSNSLHPLVLAMLVDSFNNSDTNKGDSQLIFTGHETIVMESGRLHRDQINLIQRGDSLASEIVPLSDFSPRSEENFRRGYLQGRYRGVPITGDI